MSRKSNSIGRRAILRDSIVFAAATAPLVARSTHGQDIPQLRAVVTLEGKTFEFAADKGRNLGDFKSEIGNFVQACYRVTRDDSPLTVFFRPDRNSSRIEVVFELGRLLSAAPAHLSSYSAAIYEGATQLAVIEVPRHFWFARWRWQSAPRPIVADVKELVAKGLLPPLDLGTGSSPKPAPTAAKPVSGLPGAGQIRLPEASALTSKGAALGIGAPKAPSGQANKAPEIGYSIMGMAGLAAKMGMTGERPDIGLVTEHQARYICTGAAEALSILRAQAEAGGTCPWHMRDDKSGAPVDLDASPTMTWYVGDAKDANPRIITPTCEVEVDSAHMPALAYVPYLLTGDPYHLEDLQFACNWNRGSQPPSYRSVVVQTRAFAWSMRTLAQAAKVTPATTPNWLLPRAYWERQLDGWRDYVMKRFVANPSPECAVFRALENPRDSRDEQKAPGGTHIPVWQTEFSNAVVGWMISMGFETWKPFFQWQIGSTIARTNGRSGWQRSRATPYRVLICTSASAPYFKTWAEAWALTAKLWGWEQEDPDKIIDEDMTYYAYSRASLMWAARMGVAESEACLSWLDDQIRSRGTVIPFKWRFA